MGWIPISWIIVGIYELIRSHNCQYTRKKLVDEKCIGCKYSKSCIRNDATNIEYRKNEFMKQIAAKNELKQ